MGQHQTIEKKLLKISISGLDGHGKSTYLRKLLNLNDETFEQRIEKIENDSRLEEIKWSEF